ncbi:MAG: response regulator [Desulfomonile tiedjei]|nr:response regulator [Desulfomonile tiedjei]
MSEKKILIVETEPIIGEYIADSFAAVDAGYHVLHAYSVPEALQKIGRNDVDLVFADHQGGAGIDGIKLLQGIRKMDMAVRVVLEAEDYLERDRIPALSLGCSSFLVKPVSYEKLEELLFNMLQSQQGFTGRVVKLRLEDVIQMFCYRKDSTLLTIFNGQTEGRIYIHDGGIIHVECDSLDGVEAFYEIIGWEGGEFLSQIVLQVPPQTVFIDWQSLLMEGMRQKDEIRHALAPAPEDGTGRRAGRKRRAGAVREPAPSAVQQPDKRIMIVDDSRFIRKIVQEIIESDSSLQVAGYATNGQEALARIDELKPDLILLDWDMPVMKGSTTLMHIMIRSPCPVVILSGFVGGVGANPFDLLCLGGVDFLRKPQNNWRLDGRADDLVRRVKEACRIKFDRIRRVRIPPQIQHAQGVEPHHGAPKFLVVFVSSTGGCTDLIRLIPSLPENLSAAMVILHDMQTEAIGAFVDYLDRRSQVKVQGLEPGTPLASGVCYMHPASVPAELLRERDSISVKTLSDQPALSAVDHFLVSASEVMGRNILAGLLSGGESWGSEGLKAVKKAQGITLVQDPLSSTDPRMAERALRAGIVDFKCAADNMAGTIKNLIRAAAKAETAPSRQESFHER